MRRPDPHRASWVDGRRVEAGETLIDATDPFVQHGLGLFETLAIRDGRCLDLEAHLDRIARAARRLEWRLPALEAIAEVLREAASEDPACPGWVKLLTTAGGSWVVFSGAMDLGEEGRPILAVTLPWRQGPPGPLHGLKTLNYGRHALGLRYARERGADEGLWLNHRGRVVEGCWSNVFAYRGGRLFTPAAREGVLPGVVRDRVIETAKRLGLVVHEGSVRPKRLKAADSVFVTSSLRGLCPVRRVDRLEVGRPSGLDVVFRLAAAIGRRHIGSAGAKFPARPTGE